MNFLDWVKPIDKALDIVKEAVPDKDLREQLKAELQKSKDALQLAALQTPTVPWVDAFYKVAPMLGAAAHTLVCVGLIVWKPDIDPAVLAAIGAPGSIVALKNVLKR